MTLFLGAEHLAGLASQELVMDAAWAAVDEEVAGRITVPPRLQVPFENGFLRLMPAAVGTAMGFKVMTLLEGHGTRYFIVLYDTESSALECLLDAAEVTRLRTAATTAVAGEMLVSEPPTELGLLGTGFEAAGHLRAMAALWPLRRVLVYGRDRGRREAFAARLGEELGIAVSPASSCAEAVSSTQLSVLATKSTEPVVDGDDFPPDAVILSIGSTRPDLRELDHRTLERTGTLVVDDPVQVLRECGDVMAAIEADAFDPARMISLAQASAEPRLVRRDGSRDLLSFKSVGTAVQDLTLARALHARAREEGVGRDLGELSSLKRFEGAPDPGDGAARAAVAPDSP